MTSLKRESPLNKAILNLKVNLEFLQSDSLIKNNMFLYQTFFKSRLFGRCKYSRL